jgi:diguanylate cyclase
MIGTKHIGHQIIAMMDRLGVAPLTRNYHLFYICIANSDPVLRRAVRNLGRHPTQHDLDQLIAEFCPEAVDSQLVRRHENAVLRAIEDLACRLQTEQSEMSSFHGAIERVATALSRTAEQETMTRQLLMKVTSAIEEAGKRRVASGRRALKHLDENHKEVAALRSELVHFRKLASTDPLTGLANRRSFDEALAGEKSKAIEFSLILMDIDHFKKINDAYGHAFGDGVLKLVGETTKRALRRGCFFARTGGEEFAIIVPSTTGEEGFRVAERVRHSIERLKMQRGGEEVGITISLGIANSSAVETSNQLYEAADLALYHSKNTGRNRATIYDPLREGTTGHRYQIYSG